MRESGKERESGRKRVGEREWERASGRKKLGERECVRERVCEIERVGAK